MKIKWTVDQPDGCRLIFYTNKNKMDLIELNKKAKSLIEALHGKMKLISVEEIL